MTSVTLHRENISVLWLFLSRWWMPILGYLLLINLITFCVYGWDKRAAKAGRRRVPEKTLLGLAAVGGAIGALLGMKVFHHKTKKRAFTTGVPCILAAHIVLIGVAVLLAIR